jgi:hypothetical protein
MVADAHQLDWTLLDRWAARETAVERYRAFKRRLGPD